MIKIILRLWMGCLYGGLNKMIPEIFFAFICLSSVEWVKEEHDNL